MYNPIWGTDVVLSMKVADIWYPVLCATDFTYDCIPEMIEKTGPNSGGVRQRKRRLEDHISTVSGLSFVENGDQLSFLYMLQLGVRREEHEFRADFIDGYGNERTLSGPAVIGRQGIRGPVGDFSPSEIEIFWNQEPDFDAIDDPVGGEIIDYDFLDLLVGETSVLSAGLIGKEVLGVARAGAIYNETTGTPAAGSLEYKFTSGTGTLAFDALNPSLGEKIWVLFKTT